MNPQPLGLRNQSVLFICVLLLLFIFTSFVLTEPASTTNRRGQNQSNQPSQSTSPSERDMGIGVPKHIPLKIKVKNIKNEKWAHDLEIEVTNKSNRPIYFLSFIVKPQSETLAEETVAFWLHYGRPQLNNFSAPLESTDVPLLPDETTVLKIPESQADGWEAGRAKKNKPQPKKVGLIFQALNFGDGTGYFDAQGTPVEKNKDNNRPVASNQNCLSPPGQGQFMSSFVPAVFLPVNFFSHEKIGSVLGAIFFNATTCCDEGCNKWQSSVYTCQRVCDPDHPEFPFYTQLSCDSNQPCKRLIHTTNSCWYEGSELNCAVYEVYNCCPTCGPEGDSSTCFDGIDNDGDGYIDCAEPACSVQYYLAPENCGNFVDDNCNGKVDCADPDCGNESQCVNVDGCTPNQVQACAQLQANCYAGFCYTPILVDILGDGFRLTNAQDGVLFDMGSGERYQIAWTTPNSDDAWLALDRNGNGQIDSGRELFGNVTNQPASAEPQGFFALAVFDAFSKGGNSDGRIDNRDAIFNSLKLWVDVNHNGFSEPSELHTLSSLDVAALDLDYKDSRKADEFGNLFRYRAKVYDGREARVARWAWDVFLKLAP